MNKEDQKRDRQVAKEAWQFVLKHEPGRRVLREVLVLCGDGQSPFAGNTNATLKNIGMQDVARLIKLQASTHALDDYMILLREELDHG